MIDTFLVFNNLKWEFSLSDEFSECRPTVVVSPENIDKLYQYPSKKYPTEFKILVSANIQFRGKTPEISPHTEAVGESRWKVPKKICVQGSLFIFHSWYHPLTIKKH